MLLTSKYHQCIMFNMHSNSSKSTIQHLKWAQLLIPTLNCSNWIKPMSFCTTLDSSTEPYSNMCHQLKLGHRWCTCIGATMSENGQRLWKLYQNLLFCISHIVSRSKSAWSFKLLQFYFICVYWKKTFLSLSYSSD